MATQHIIGENTVVAEDDSGNTVVRNTRGDHEILITGSSVETQSLSVGEAYIGESDTEENRAATISDIGGSIGLEPVQETADGSTTEFRFTVDTDVAIEDVFVQPASVAASTDFYSEYDTSTGEVVVIYARAPGEGETLKWKVLLIGE